MATTVANVPVSGRAYTIVGALKETVTDVTVATNSETLTAAQLGLSYVAAAEAEIQAGQTSDTAAYVTCTITGGTSVVVATFAAAGTAAVTSATTVIRVKARGN
jgi:hypothetical protein